MKKSLFALCCSAILLAPVAFAGGGHDHAPKYGGVVRESGNLSYELVVKADRMTLHVSDHGKPFATAGAKAEGILYAGNEKTSVTLVPAGENTLAAPGSFKAGVGVRVEVNISLPGKPEAKLIFRLK
jgi:hypothetical protein